METRIYKRLLNRKETIDSFTVWFKPTKKAAQDGAIINAYCCNIDPYGRVCGYWEDYPPNTRVRADIRLGKRQKLADVPKQRIHPKPAKPATGTNGMKINHIKRKYIKMIIDKEKSKHIFNQTKYYIICS